MAWLTNWNYRKAITISNTGSALSDYQVLITVGTATLISSGKLLPNCNDIRFTSSDGSTILNHWIESGINTGSTKIWVKIPSIATSTNTIYFYYNSPTATYDNSVGGTNTFILFSNFSSPSLSPEWTVNHISGGSSGISSTTYYSSPYASYVGIGGVHNGFTWAPKPATTEMIYKNVILPNTDLRFEYMAAKPNATNWDGGFQTFIYADGVYTQIDNFCNSLGSTTTCGWTFRSVDISTYKNKSVSIGFYASAYNGAGDQVHTQYQDDVRIRKYSSPEPTISAIGTEESSSPANISATNMTATPSETPCRVGLCTVTVDVTWTNSGGSTGSFVPSITIDGNPITPVYSSQNLGADASVTKTFTLTGLSAGTHPICPYPN